MRRLFTLALIIYGSTLHIYGQTKKDCSILGGKTDTVICGDKKMILELNFCESNGLYQDGTVTDINGKEEFCFFYTYDNKNHLKKITFWTFVWKNSGYETKEKIGVLKIVNEQQELIIKNKYKLDPTFVKTITKT